MKPYQQIDLAIQEAKESIQKIADDFNKKTGGVINHISVDFIDVTDMGSPTKETFVNNVKIETTH
jgi:hypothetical protein